MRSASQYTDTSSVDVSVLNVVKDVDVYRTILEGELFHLDLFSAISRNYPSERCVKTCVVEVEYTNTDCVIYQDSFYEYLETYSTTIATPERIASTIREDLSDVLECDKSNVYVQLNYEDGPKTVIDGTLT
jgi:hypothetical protein